METRVISSVVDAIAELPRPTQRPLVVGIDGPSGSGKSHLTAIVADQFAATVIAMDAIYPGWQGLQAALDILVTQVLRPLSQGHSTKVDTWDWTTSRPGLPREISCDPATVIVIDGVGSGCRAARPYLDLLIWVTADESTRKQRALARDDWRESTQWQNWAEQEERYFREDDPRGSADFHLITDH